MLYYVNKMKSIFAAATGELFQGFPLRLWEYIFQNNKYDIKANLTIGKIQERPIIIFF
jgi:hypothetical protein